MISRLKRLLWLAPERLSADERFERAYRQLRPPKMVGFPSITAEGDNRIVAQLLELGIPVSEYEVDVPAYRQFRGAADYPSDYYSDNIAEKSLEHFIAASVMELKPADTYIDIASENSPAPEIYERLFRSKVYRQDRDYAPGLHGEMIGGDAAAMPVPDAFADKMALHCSFEHFENDSDTRFLTEVGRILRPGGVVCIVPFYLAEEYCIITDPEDSGSSMLSYEEGVMVRAARGWKNRHGRFYDPAHVHSRLWVHLGALSGEVLRIRGASEIDPSCYVRFGLVIRRPE